MLNTKYFIQKNADGQTQASQVRPTASGPVWFVKSILFVKNADEEISALNHFSPRDTAIVQDIFKDMITGISPSDSGSTIRLVKNDVDVINYISQSSANHFAVFSEVYYDAGWKAFIDEKETQIVKVNYVLRGLVVPAGKHSIQFRFEPKGYYTGKSLTSIFSVILILLLIAGIYMEWRNSRNKLAVK
jgi:uncharacterized membrane protein YfhO